MSDLLTPEEQAWVHDIGQLWNRLCKIVGDGPTRGADLGEMVHHVHALQQAVMSNAAARAYPDQYRPLGGTLRKPDDNGKARSMRADISTPISHAEAELERQMRARRDSVTPKENE